MNSSLLKALDLLACFSPSQPRRSLTELSRELQIPKSTIHRLLRTLQSRGYIEQVKGDEYALGNNIITLTQAVRVNVEVRDRAATIARSLAEQSRESVYVAVPEYDHALYIYALETSRRLQARTAVGDRVPLHCTGIGKACLSYMPQPRREHLIATMPLVGSTTRTITSRDALANEVAEILRRGYSTDNQENEDGTYCIAAPFLDTTGGMVGAISISGNSPEILGSRQSSLASTIQEAAAQISNHLGFVASRRSTLPRFHKPDH